MYITRVKKKKVESKIRTRSGRKRAKAIKTRPGSSQKYARMNGDEGEMSGIH